jgi:hypothetical protein
MTKYQEKLTQNELGEPVFEVYLDGKLSRTETPQDRGLFREKQFYFIFSRVALNPKTLQNISGFFIQKICFKIPNREGYDCHFFYWSKDVSLPHIRVLDSRMGRFAGLTDAIYVHKTAQPKRITREQRFSILKSGEYEGVPCLGSFAETGETFVQPKSN